MEEKKVPSTVKDILEWKVKTKKEKWPSSVEDYNISYTETCGGKEMTDVLFSFLGIYAVGVWVYNKDKEKNKDLFKRECNKIRVTIKANKKYNQILCSQNFLLQLQDEKIADIDVSELNKDIEDYVNLYFSVGNLIPMWPGGNVLKGNQNKGFMDIPELFFCKYYKWYQILTERENAYLQEMTEYLKNNQSHYSNLKDFLDSVDTKEKYNKYITHIVSIIRVRAKKINYSNF